MKNLDKAINVSFVLSMLCVVLIVPLGLLSETGMLIAGIGFLGFGLLMLVLVFTGFLIY